MLSNSHVSISTVRKNLKWLWLPATGLTVLASLRSDLVLQLLSAMAMFTLLFALVAALAVLIVLVLVEAVHVLEWAAAQFASTGGDISCHRLAMLEDFGHEHRSFLMC